MKGLGLLSLGLTPLLKACDILNSEGQIKEARMATGITAQGGKKESVRILPIDAMAPDRFETATFALG